MGRDAMDLADPESDVADAAVTLFVHSGIASSDVICCARLGLFSQGEDHRQAATLLAQVDAGLSAYLATLLELKTKAAYSHVRVNPTELTRAVRAAENLLFGRAKDEPRLTAPVAQPTRRAARAETVARSVPVRSVTSSALDRAAVHPAQQERGQRLRGGRLVEHAALVAGQVGAEPRRRCVEAVAEEQVRRDEARRQLGRVQVPALVEAALAASAGRGGRAGPRPRARRARRRPGRRSSSRR